MVKHPYEFKEKIVSRYYKGESVEILAKETGIGKTTIYEWINSSKERLNMIIKALKLDITKIK